MIYNFKVEWFDGEYPTCYMSTVDKTLTGAIAAGYNGFARYKSCKYFKVFPVYNYEVQNEELEGRNPLYTGFREHKGNMRGFYDIEILEDKCSIYVIEIRNRRVEVTGRDENGNYKYGIKTDGNSYVVAAHSQAEALSIIPLKDITQVTVHYTGRFTDKPGIISVPTWERAYTADEYGHKEQLIQELKNKNIPF